MDTCLTESALRRLSKEVADKDPRQKPTTCSTRQPYLQGTRLLLAMFVVWSGGGGAVLSTVVNVMVHINGGSGCIAQTFGFPQGSKNKNLTTTDVRRLYRDQRFAQSPMEKEIIKRPKTSTPPK
eukprot:4368682-Amphidinium_carterae.1